MSVPSDRRRRVLVAALVSTLVVAVPLASGAPVAAAPEPALAARAAAPPAVAPPAAAAAAGPAAAPALTTVAAPTLSRVAGADRYATAVRASRLAFPTGTTAPVVFLVSGTSQAVGHGAVAAAARLGGSVLLTRPDGIPSSTAAELDRLNPGRIVLVGDTTVLATAVARAATRYAPTVSRVGSASAAGTSQALNRFAFPSATAAWVVTSRSATDAVVGATSAGAHRAPVVVLDGRLPDLPAANATLLRDLGVTSVTVVGSTGAVSAGIEADLRALVGSTNVVRASGSDRYAVAARVNALGWPAMAPGTAYLAGGQETTNAFAGALLAAHQKRPLYLTVPFCVPASVRPALVGAGVTRVALLGGEASVRLLAGRLEACRSTETASSVWVLVNKRNGLSPRGFVPSNLVVPSMPYTDGQRLRSDAAAALARMAAGSYAAGAGRVGIDTAYRSYDTQKALYAKWLALRGRTWVDTWYLRAGFSEHQTGLTVDLLPIGRSNCTINDCIDETPQGVWLARNAWRYGFILRYEKGRTSTTGVGFEPWHFRFVGTPLAKAYHDGGWHTYEQFLGEPAAPTY
jgi:LAS superfamily LD-carboxypeptidase LdcB/putative cell wall-binding protein